ncbi:MAG: ECF transporter S component [Firmicutes bacterium]|nr:ECF transporter S component [Bacillota bacterium]NLL87761.1 ECF transporter S component [Bacillota bacterium]
MRNREVELIVKMGILTALSIVLVVLIHFPIFSAAPYLEYDPADVPILIGTFLYGPANGLLLTVAVSVIQGLTVSPGTMPIGVIMHIIATGTLAVTAGLVYRRKHTRQGAVIALICGSLTMTVVMIPLNLIFTPMYTGISRSEIWPLFRYIIPFNLIKASANSVITFLLYKSVGRILRVEMVKRYNR